MQEIAVNTGLGRLGSTQVGGESTKVLTLSEPWERVRRGRVNEGKGAPVIDGIHRAIAVLEEGGSTMEAAGPLAEAGGSACEVIRALYQILPDRVQKGRGSVLNREKLHLQTLLLSVCQEGLHLIAGRELEERETQRRLDQYQQAEPENRYEPIIDQFIDGKNKLVRVVIEDIEAGYLQSKLDQILITRGLRDTIKTSVVDGVVYLEKDKT